MAQNEKDLRQAQFDQIVTDTAGMSQEERWAYYDAHPGSQEIASEFKNQNIVTGELRDFASAAKTQGLNGVVETIDRVTEGLDADGYIKWLDQHPSAKQDLIRINQLRDQLVNGGK